MSTRLHRYRLSAAEHRRLDRLAIARYGFTEQVLMENAAAGAARAILERWPEGRRALVAVGRGNNGGDGLGVARYLHLAGWSVDLLLLGGQFPRAGASAAMAQALHGMGLAQLELERCGDDYDLAIDALCGTGFQGAPRGELALWLEVLGRRSWTTVALDLPSGLNADANAPSGLYWPAQWTLSFAARKFILDGAGMGEWQLVDLGIPEAVYLEVLAERRAESPS